MITLDQRHLQHGEDHGQRNHAERLERHPEIRGLGAPDHLIEHRHGEEEQRPAQGQHPPAGRGEIERLVEQDRDEGTAEQQAAAQDRPEQRIDDGRLDLDEGLVVQPQRQRAEHQDDDAGHDRHDRHMARHRVGHHQGHDHRDHEGRGRHEQVGLGIGDEENHQRTKLGGELEQRMRNGLVHVRLGPLVLRWRGRNRVR